MGYKAQGAVTFALQAIISQDTAAANQVIADDEDIDALEVDRTGMIILASFAPVANDLKNILSFLRLAGLYERIGDEAVSIARHANKLAKATPLLPETYLLEPLAQPMSRHFRALNAAVASFNQAEIALMLPQLNDLHAQARTLSKQIIALPDTQPDNLLHLTELIFVSRSLERVAYSLQRIAEEATRA